MISNDEYPMGEKRLDSLGLIIKAFKTSTSSVLASPSNTDSANVENASSNEETSDSSSFSPRAAGRGVPSATRDLRTARRASISRVDEGERADVRPSKISASDSGSTRHVKASLYSRAAEAGGSSLRRLTVSLASKASKT